MMTSTQVTGWCWPVMFFTCACSRLAPLPPPVPLGGNEAEIAEFSGKWLGRYWIEGRARRGTLSFLLESGADTARGDVTMTFATGLEMYRDKAEDLSRNPCTTIDITIVQVRGRTIRGDLAPYYDPDCGCRTRTVFEGELIGDSVAGTFISRRESGDVPPLTGRWFAIRE